MSDQMDKMESTQEIGTEQTAKEKRAAKKKERAVKKASGTGKKHRKAWIAAIVTVAVIGVGLYVKASSSKVLPSVLCQAAAVGDVEETLSASGKVGSAETQTYYAPVGTIVQALNVKEGDAVHKGEVLVAFDTAELELTKKKADLDAEASEGSYQSAMQQSNENQNKYSDASIGLDELKQMKEDQEQYVQGLKYELEDDKNAKRKDLNEWDKKLMQEQNYQNRKLSEQQAYGGDTESISEVIDNINSQRADVANQLSMIDSDEKILQKQRLIDAEQKKLEDMQEEIQKRESKKDSSENGILNGYDKKSKEASVESARLNADQAASDLEKAQEGIIADFDGIISGIKTAAGSRVEKGSELFTIQSSSAVQVTVELSKYDLEKVKEGQSATVTVAGVSYSGTVSRINRVAQNNAQNTPVVYADVTIENPDGNIFLGIEGKAEILTGSAEGVVLVPYEAVNTDKEGDFCYLVKDGVIVRQNVVTGISSDMDVEIKEGISEGDTVVISSDMDLMEGLQVNPVMQ